MSSDLLTHVEIIQARETHAPWILSTFRHQARRVIGSSASQVRCEEEAMRRLLRGSLGRAAVAVPAGAPESGMGWALGMDGALLFAYVSHEFRQQGLGGGLIATVLGSSAPPVRVAFWTRDAEAMRSHGYPIEYSIDAFRALCRYARRDYRPHQHQPARAA